VSKKGKNTFGGLGATVVDSLDTMMLMNCTSCVERAMLFIEHDLNFDRDEFVSVFESM
jgi:mannosyl-oligosaccharide alpha-1,2-mannosidase